MRPCRALATAGAAGFVLAFTPGMAAAKDSVSAENERRGFTPEVSAEVERRARAADNARDLIAQGDEAAAAGNTSDAVTHYRAAVDALPASAAAFRELRDAAVKRYSAAAVTRAEELAARGEYDQARALLNDVLSPRVAPGHKAATKLLRELDDPDRHNPALSPAHADNVQKVSRLLRLAQGLMDRGSFEEAKSAYNQVLVADPENVAARRGLEQAEREISNYLRAARDHTRSRMINEVDRMWESPVEAGTGADATLPGDPVTQEPAAEGSTGKLRLISIPEISFSGAQLVDILPELARLSIEYDTTEPDPARRGVNVIFDPGDKGPGGYPPVSLSVKRVSLDRLLGMICRFTGTQWRFDGRTVTVMPLDAVSVQINTRSFRVPPGFLSTAGTGGVNAGSLFASPELGGGEDGASARATIRRIDAQQFFEQAGVPFPEGTSARYLASSGTLVVRNTEENLNLIEDYVLSLSSQQEREVLVEVRLLKTDEQTLNELGFDHLLGQFNVGSSGIFAGGGTYGNALAPDVQTAVPRDFITPGTGLPIGQYPVTAGLRGAFELNSRPSINSLITASGSGTGGVSPPSGPSPGFASIAGAFTDPQFVTILRGLNQKRNVELGTTQKLVLKSGQRGTAASIRSIPFPTEYDPPQIPQSIQGSQTITIDDGGNVSVFDEPQAPGFPVTPTQPQNFEAQDTGSALDVEATVSPDGSTVDLVLSVSFREFDGFVNYGSPIVDPATGVVLTENRIIQPVVSTNTASANVTLYDGAHMAIGGLLDGKWETIEDKVPILGSLPLVGRLFKSEVRQATRRAIVYFVTVKVIDPAGVARQDEIAAREAASSAGLPP